MSSPSTPLPVPLVKSLSIICTALAVGSYIYTLPEKDEFGRDHALSGINRATRKCVQLISHVDEKEEAWIRANIINQNKQKSNSKEGNKEN